MKIDLVMRFVWDSYLRRYASPNRQNQATANLQRLTVPADTVPTEEHSVPLGCFAYR